MNTQLFLRVLSLMAAMFSPLTCPGADVVFRKSTKTALQGEITEMSATEFTLKFRLKSKPPATIPAYDVKRVEWDKEPARLRLLRVDERNGRLGKALQGYAHVLLTAKGANLRTDLRFLIARTTAKRALIDDSKMKEALEKLEKIHKSQSNHFRYYETVELLGKLYAQDKDFSKAKELFSEISRVPVPHYQMIGQLALADISSKQGDFSAATEAYEAILRATGGQTNQSHLFAAMLGKASCLQQQDKHAEAVSLLEQLTEQAPVNATRIQSKAYLLQGESLRLMEKPKLAIFAYLHVDLLFFREPSLHAESLFWLSKLWNKVDHPKRSSDAATKLKSQYPDSEWSKRLSKTKK